MKLEAGTRAGGKYRLARPIASGGMGQVWLARSDATGADVALKVLRRSDSAVNDARFRNEARFAAGLAHRNIVRVFDFIEEPDGTLLLVMELLRGESLAEMLARRGALSTREAIAVVLPVLSALGYAHASGVVHRDVSPANVFLSVEPDGEVVPKLVDFGIAKLPDAGSLTLEGAVLGTPRYMAPEQIRAAGDIDGRADLFSVAVVVYESVTGASPFAAATPAASLAAVLEATVDPDPRIEPRVWIELQRALSKRPYQRHRDASEMADALRAALGETDADLAALLRRDPPLRGEALLHPTAPAPATGDGQSFDAVQRAGIRRRGLVVAVGAAALLAGAIGALQLRSRADHAVATTVAPSPRVVVEPQAVVVSPPGSTAPAAAEPPAPASPPPSASRAPPLRMRVRATPPVRPIATTPGF
jgi:serine/threonine protein kinase